MQGILPAWGRILAGYTPAMSIEITRECPLRCPGCYAYGDDHLGGDLTLREVRDFKGQELVAEACRKGWEGLIAKRADSPYTERRYRDWLKFKCERGQELVIGGFTDPQ